MVGRIREQSINRDYDDSTVDGPLELDCTIQHYDWGIRGGSSLIARMAKARGLVVHDDRPYAELWMGTHPNGPSSVKLSDGTVQPLRDHLGDGGGDLPFLFKILSVGKALSIQAHPDAGLAAQLHVRFPSIYKDPNHKPEIAVALSPFEALCGFRTIPELVLLAQTVPELEMVSGRDAVGGLIQAIHEPSSQEAALKAYFTAMMKCPLETVTAAIAAFQKRMADTTTKEPTELEQVCLTLQREYPDEVGCFCVFVLNHVRLEPGESVFLAANEPHAYLRGECVECMALSDNVVRAGLTPKFRDLETLLAMLTYRTYTAEQLLFQPTKLSESLEIYEPPVSEFALIKAEMHPGMDAVSFTPPSDQPSILIVVKGAVRLEEGGRGRPVVVTFGTVLLLPPHQPITLTTATEADALVFVAFAPKSLN